MLSISSIAAAVIGFLLGIAAAVVLRIARGRTTKEIAVELLREKEQDRRADIEAVIDRVKASFGSLSLEALSRSTEEFLKLARSGFDAERQAGVGELEARKGLIDQQLARMTVELDDIGRLMKGPRKG